MRKITPFLLTTISIFCLSTLCLSASCIAQEMLEGAAKQAELDAALAASQIQNLQQQEAAQAGIDGVDAPELAVENQMIESRDVVIAESERAQAQAMQEMNNNAAMGQ